MTGRDLLDILNRTPLDNLERRILLRVHGTYLEEERASGVRVGRKTDQRDPLTRDDENYLIIED